MWKRPKNIFGTGNRFRLVRENRSYLPLEIKPLQHVRCYGKRNKVCTAEDAAGIVGSQVSTVLVLRSYCSK